MAKEARLRELDMPVSVDKAGKEESKALSTPTGKDPAGGVSESIESESATSKENKAGNMSNRGNDLTPQQLSHFSAAQSAALACPPPPPPPPQSQALDKKSQTLAELAELRAKKLTKYIHKRFDTMAERNAAVKAAEEAILSQLESRAQSQSSSKGSGGGKYTLGAMDKMYMEKNRQDSQRNQKRRETLLEYHGHKYKPPTTGSTPSPNPNRRQSATADASARVCGGGGQKVKRSSVNVLNVVKELENVKTPTVKQLQPSNPLPSSAYEMDQKKKIGTIAPSGNLNWNSLEQNNDAKADVRLGSSDHIRTADRAAGANQTEDTQPKKKEANMALDGLVKDSVQRLETSKMPSDMPIDGVIKSPWKQQLPHSVQQDGSSSADGGDPVKPQTRSTNSSPSSSPSSSALVTHTTPSPVEAELTRTTKCPMEEVELPGEALPEEGVALTGEEAELPREEAELPREEAEIQGEEVLLSGEEAELPGEEVQLSGEEAELPGVEVQLPGGELELPEEELELPEEELAREEAELPGEELQLPGEELQLSGESLQSEFDKCFTMLNEESEHGSEFDAEVRPSSSQSAVISEDDAIARAEEMARRMAMEVDWWCTTSGSGTDYDDEEEDDHDEKYARKPVGKVSDENGANGSEEEEWITYWSDEHDREYYFNPNTGAVVWTKPSALSASSTLEKAMEAVEQSSSMQQSDNYASVMDYSKKKKVVEKDDYVPVMDFTKPKKKNTQAKKNLPDQKGHRNNASDNSTSTKRVPKRAPLFTQLRRRFGRYKNKRVVFFFLLVSFTVLGVTMIKLDCIGWNYASLENTMDSNAEIIAGEAELVSHTYTTNTDDVKRKGKDAISHTKEQVLTDTNHNNRGGNTDANVISNAGRRVTSTAPTKKSETTSNSPQKKIDKVKPDPKKSETTSNSPQKKIDKVKPDHYDNGGALSPSSDTDTKKNVANVENQPPPTNKLIIEEHHSTIKTIIHNDQTNFTDDQLPIRKRWFRNKKKKKKLSSANEEDKKENGPSIKTKTKQKLRRRPKFCYFPLAYLLSKECNKQSKQNPIFAHLEEFGIVQ